MQQDHHPPIQEFLEWQKSEQTVRNGYRGSREGQSVVYIPASSVETFFKEKDRLKATLRVLFPGDEDGPDADIIQRYYIRVFAILLEIGQGNMIARFLQLPPKFRDQSLPFDQHQEGFPLSSTCDLHALFWEHQWKYCPETMIGNMGFTMNNESILPFHIEEHVDSGGSADVYKIRVDKDYNQLNNSSVEVSLLCSTQADCHGLLYT